MTKKEKDRLPSRLPRRILIVCTLTDEGCEGPAAVDCGCFAEKVRGDENSFAGENPVKDNLARKSKSSLPLRRAPIYSSHIDGCVNPFLVLEEKVMLSSVAAELDFIEELRLRRWAREHYVPRGERELSWHPVILDEMDRKDVEMTEADAVCTCA
jgi:hypothetical protein